MILLDTDHLTILANVRASGHAALTARMHASSEGRFGIPVVSVEEQCRGWLAQLNRHSDVHKQLPAYDRLAKLFDFLCEWEIVPFDTRSADRFKQLKKQRIRVGTQDLKIACIALVHGALLLSANLRDYHRVPGLLVENWLE